MSVNYFDISDKVALIVGGNRGMGYGISQHFVEAGAKVMACSNDTPAIEKSHQEFGNNNNFATSFCDVTISDDLKKTVQETVTRFGKLNVLVNCAGIQPYGTVVTTSEELWDKVMAINVKGMFLATKYAVPEMEKVSGGSIINIASVQAFASQSNVVAYTASKGAVLSMTRAMSMDHAPKNIRVNAICPASINTPLLQNAAKELAEQSQGKHTPESIVKGWAQCHPIGRVGKISEIASLVHFLASDASGFITGADIKIDGGVLSDLGIPLPK